MKPELVERVVQRLGFVCAPTPDLEGLRALYGAWCAAVPFDNVRKMIAVRGAKHVPLPGAHADDFFEHWLSDGCGGTCWSTSNALFELASALGFEARRGIGHMRDMGVVNHGTVRVLASGSEWIIDSSLLFNAPVPLTDETFVQADPVFSVEVERDIDGRHVLWVQLPPFGFLKCRLQPDEVNHDFYLERYETSREASPFNQRLYARRNRPNEMVVLAGSTRHVKTAAGVAAQELTEAELRESLLRDIGLSERLVEEWARSGSMADSLAPLSGSPPPPPDGVPPSQRT
jgi:N-hydroxyarylamine O-acetyltransferase